QRAAGCLGQRAVEAAGAHWRCVGDDLADLVAAIVVDELYLTAGGGDAGEAIGAVIAVALGALAGAVAVGIVSDGLRRRVRAADAQRGRLMRFGGVVI